jgi:hypothetical protein
MECRGSASLHARDFSSTHAPADDCRLDGAAGIHALPNPAAPSTQERNDICADVILAQELKRLVRRRDAFVDEGIDSLLPCRHAVLIIRAVRDSMPTRHAATATRRAYITPLSPQSTSEDRMAFKPNYGRDRAERARAARAQAEEKQRKKDEKTALRKAKRVQKRLTSINDNNVRVVR